MYTMASVVWYWGGKPLGIYHIHHVFIKSFMHTCTHIHTCIQDSVSCYTKLNISNVKYVVPTLLYTLSWS